jgi:hypothetical protein
LRWEFKPVMLLRSRLIPQLPKLQPLAWGVRNEINVTRNRPIRFDY